MNNDNENYRRDRQVVVLIAASLLFAGFGMLFLFVWGSQDCCHRFGAGGLLACGAFSIGSLLGLLFGIPRIAQVQSEGANVSDSKFLAANNNLIQISDWLTKILVGAGLTQLTKVPAALESFGTHYGTTIGGADIAVFLLMHFIVSGFLAGYLFTRLVLQHALHRADKVPDVAKDTSLLRPEEPISNPEPSPESQQQIPIAKDASLENSTMGAEDEGGQS